MGGGLVDDGVEPVVLVRRVVHRPDGTVRLDQAVLSLDDVPVPGLVLGLHVAGVVVVHSVLERILRVRLQCTTGQIRNSTGESSGYSRSSLRCAPAHVRAPPDRLRPAAAARRTRSAEDRVRTPPPPDRFLPGMRDRLQSGRRRR